MIGNTRPIAHELAPLRAAPEWFFDDYVMSYARSRPARLALISGPERLTWQQLCAAMQQTAASLMRWGVKRGDRVAYLLPNGAQALCFTLAILHLRAVAVPLSPLLTSAQMEALLADASASTVVLGQEYSGHADIGAASILRLAVGFRAEGWGEFVVAPGEGSPPASADVAHDPYAEAVVIYSSGTTGVPKGIVHTVRSRQLLALGMGLSLRMQERSVALVATPIASNATWMLLAPALTLGATIVWLPAFSRASWLSSLEQEKVTHAFCVPLMLQAILRDSDLAAAVPVSHTLVMLLSAGSTLAREQKRLLRQRFGPVLFELYGCTEGIATLLTPETHDSKLGSVGQAFLGSEIAILVDGTRRGEADEVGEIIGRGPGLMSCYLGRPAETAAAIWIDERGNSWWRSGDVGSVDTEGYLSLKDRLKDMIVSGGLNVYPADIEAVLAQRPELEECAVIGVPHSKWGEVPLAVVRLRAGHSIAIDDLLAWTNSRVAKHQRIAGVVTVGKPLPRNALDKVLKHELRALYGKSD